MVDVFLLEYSKIVFSHILVANNWLQVTLSAVLQAPRISNDSL